MATPVPLCFAAAQLAWPPYFRLEDDYTIFMNSQLHIITFDRPIIKTLNFSQFLSFFNPCKMAKTQLQAMMGNTIFSVSGYENVTCEIYHIPEIRRFYNKLSEHWPFWIYAAATQVDESVKSIYLCRVKALSSIKRGSEVVNHFDANDFLRLVDQDIAWCYKIAEIAQIPNNLIEDQIRKVLKLLGL